MDSSMNISPFGAWLTRQIEERLMTKKAFAEKLGVAESTLHRWIVFGPHNIRGLNIVRIARALQLQREQVETAMQRAA